MSPHGAVGPIEPLAAESVRHWDDEADVVVVGLGCAGTSAAITAAESGADVLALERAGAPGGTSALSGGLIYLGGGTPVQEACGFPDTPENMERFLLAACGPGADADKVHRYCADSVDHFHWLVDHGVPFSPTFNDEPNREPFDDAGLVFSGGEDSWPFTEIAEPAARGHHPRFPDTAGGFLMECLAGALGRTDARVIGDTTAVRLVSDRDGAVAGAVVRADGAERVVRARRGAVLAAGGFVFNEAMLEHYCPTVLQTYEAWRIGQPNDDGRGIRLGQGAGGALRRMHVFECALPLGPPHRMARALLVNRDGRRFVNEDTYTGRIGHQALVDQGGEVYMIVSEEIFEVNFVGMRVAWAAETVEELARDIGLPEAGLAATVARYNDAATRGKDPEWHKAPDFLVPLRAPFGAVDLRVASKTIYAPFTLGGLATDIDGRVLTEHGEPVGGLFAAGRTTAGIAAGGYVSGISLGDGTFFGRRAGAAATRTAP
ncbi:MAG: FAD-dependent oxidoreductase [Actinobacteria bacterium]|nr:FAD-dependent oxidoreductase [Actinomycetota bacterium]